MKKPQSAKVHDLTRERARRGTLPWAFTVDLALDDFKATLFKGATPHDLLVMADAAERWSKALREAARTLRAGFEHPDLGKKRVRLERDGW